MKRLLLLLLFVAAVLGASAQQVETAEVYLRDGRIVRGRIVERLRGGMIRVQTVEGQSFTFMPAQVLNVIDIRRFFAFHAGSLLEWIRRSGIYHPQSV